MRRADLSCRDLLSRACFTRTPVPSLFGKASKVSECERVPIDPRILLHASVQKDVVSYNSLIAACAGSAAWQLAVDVLAHMPVSPDSTSRLVALFGLKSSSRCLW